MNKIKNMQYLLDEEVFTVFNKEVVTVSSNNKGFINQDALDKRKRILLKTAVEYLTSEVVRVKRGYPTIDEQDVGIEVDCVVMNREVFNQLKSFIDELT